MGVSGAVIVFGAATKDSWAESERDSFGDKKAAWKKRGGPGTTGAADNLWKVTGDEKKTVTQTDNHFKVAIYWHHYHLFRE